MPTIQEKINNRITNWNIYNKDRLLSLNITPIPHGISEEEYERLKKEKVTIFRENKTYKDRAKTMRDCSRRYYYEVTKPRKEQLRLQSTISQPKYTMEEFIDLIKQYKTNKEIEGLRDKLISSSVIPTEDLPVTSITNISQLILTHNDIPGKTFVMWLSNEIVIKLIRLHKEFNVLGSIANIPPFDEGDIRRNFSIIGIVECNDEDGEKCEDHPYCTKTMCTDCVKQHKYKKGLYVALYNKYKDINNEQHVTKLEDILQFINLKVIGRWGICQGLGAKGVAQVFRAGICEHTINGIGIGDSWYEDGRLAYSLYYLIDGKGAPIDIAHEFYDTDNKRNRSKDTYINTYCAGGKVGEIHFIKVHDPSNRLTLLFDYCEYEFSIQFEDNERYYCVSKAYRPALEIEVKYKSIAKADRLGKMTCIYNLYDRNNVLSRKIVGEGTKRGLDEGSHNPPLLDLDVEFSEPTEILMSDSITIVSESAEGPECSCLENEVTNKIEKACNRKIKEVQQSKYYQEFISSIPNERTVKREDISSSQNQLNTLLQPCSLNKNTIISKMKQIILTHNNIPGKTFIMWISNEMSSELIKYGNEYNINCLKMSNIPIEEGDIRNNLSIIGISYCNGDNDECTDMVCKKTMCTDCISDHKYKDGLYIALYNEYVDEDDERYVIKLKDVLKFIRPNIIGKWGRWEGWGAKGVARVFRIDTSSLTNQCMYDIDDMGIGNSWYENGKLSHKLSYIPYGDSEPIDIDDKFYNLNDKEGVLSKATYIDNHYNEDGDLSWIEIHSDLNGYTIEFNYDDYAYNACFSCDDLKYSITKIFHESEVKLTYRCIYTQLAEPIGRVSPVRGDDTLNYPFTYITIIYDKDGNIDKQIRSIETKKIGNREYLTKDKILKPSEYIKPPVTSQKVVDICRRKMREIENMEQFHEFRNTIAFDGGDEKDKVIDSIGKLRITEQFKCPYVYKKGNKMGEKCGTIPNDGNQYCAKHRVREPNEDRSTAGREDRVRKPMGFR